MEYRPHLSARAGFTLIELAVVATILILGTSVLLTAGGSGENHVRTVYYRALQMKTDLADALATAEAKGTDALVIGEIVGGQGRFGAAEVDRGADVASMSAQDRVFLDRGTQWGRGTATIDPLGRAIGTYAVPAALRCSAGRGCNLGIDGSGEPRTELAYYVTHEKDASAVAALILSQDGVLQIYRYLPTTGTWTVEGPR